ncbi:amino acid permease [Methylophilaceae bacterium]|jgi:basic amino acid/polyamine antiporter, APA family|nr:amino acid permease [Methylophilaceae bacterium]
MLKKLFRKKNIDSKSDEKLNRCLTSFDLTLLGIGCIIGTGIFVLTGIAAANQAGPAVILSFLASGFACAFAALSYAELSSSVGGCGSAYGYTYVAFGEFIAWIVGWILLMEYGMSIAAVANGWSGYFNNALIAMGIGLPDALVKPPSLGGIINLPASIIILMIMILLIIGIKESAKFNKIMVAVKVSAILIFIAFAMFNVNPENWSPFMPYGWFETLPSGKTVGVLAGASIVFFAYVGFDAVSTAAEEAINPQRDLPKGIINSLLFCTVIYIIVAALLTGVVPYQELNVSSPVAFALAKIGFPWASALVSTGVIAGLATVMLVLYYALTRIIFAMSRDGLLPTSLSSVNQKTQTPIKTILICGIFISIVAGFTSLGTLAEIVNIGTLSAFVIVCLGVIFLRKKSSSDNNTFRNKWHPVVPVLGIISCSLLMLFLPVQTWIRFLFWILIGIGMYFVYSYRNSKLN